MLYTGAVHFGPDYFYYLSFISQGATRWLSSYQLFTAETTVPQLIGWYYTLPGHILLPIIQSPIVIYQILGIAGSLFYLVMSFLFIRTLFPNRDRLQMFVFLLFLTSATLPQIVNTGGHNVYTYMYQWYNFGDPFERLTNIPHHLLSEGGSLLLLYVALKWWRTGTHKVASGIAMAIFGLIVAGIQPVWWVLITIVLGITGLGTSKWNRANAILPAIIIGCAGLPMILYLRFFLYLTPDQVSWWSLAARPGNQAAMSIWEYIKGNGILVITAILGLPFWFRSMSRERFTLTFITVLSFIFYFSPIPNVMHIEYIRFVSIFPTLFFAAVTGQMIGKLLARLPAYRHILLVTAASLIVIALPLDAQLLAFRNVLLSPNNAYYYLSMDIVRSYQYAATHSKPTDMFLVAYPFDLQFAGLVGRRIYFPFSHPVWPIHVAEKQQSIDVLNSQTTPEAEKARVLKESGINYILNESSMPPQYAGLIPVYKNARMTLYKVPAL